jgi:hypothetical protein
MNKACDEAMSIGGRAEFADVLAASSISAEGLVMLVTRVPLPVPSSEGPVSGPARYQPELRLDDHAPLRHDQGRLRLRSSTIELAQPLLSGGPDF